MDTLTMADRGDCCTAQARVLVAKGEYSLLFCFHHYEKNSLVLLEQGWDVIIDDRSKLLAKAGAEVR